MTNKLVVTLSRAVKVDGIKYTSEVDVTSGTVESANNLQSISSDMELLSINMNNIEEKIKTADNMSTKTNGLGQEGIAIVKTLMEKSSETKNSIEVLSEITTQTNMLSLNATIEAARAGEAGKINKIAGNIHVVTDKVVNYVKETIEIVAVQYI